jgi:ABC-type lipoprotein release transport system permease subunit
MTSRALAWRTMTANPARALLAVIGIGIIGALLFDMLLLSNGLLISFRDLLDTSGYDVRVVASDGFPAVRVPILHARALVSDLSRLDEVQAVAAIRMDRAAITVAGRQREKVTLLAVSEGDDHHLWRIMEGKNLGTSEQTNQPIVVSVRLAKALGVVPGATIDLRASPPGGTSAIPSVAFRVAGIAQFGFDLGDELTAATTREAFERVYASEGHDEADVVLVGAEPSRGPQAAVTVIARLRPDLRAYSNEQIVTQFNQNGFAYFRQISLVLSSITLGFAFLLTATLLTVSVNQRLGEMAALRALGFPRRRIAATLLWESALLVGVGGLLALPLGGLLAVELDHILRGMPGLPERLHFFVLEPRALLWHVALLTISGLGAATYPIWVAARLPIAATLRREVVS